MNLSKEAELPPVDAAESELVLREMLGYRFKDEELLRRALTHSSSTADKLGDNERFEFFGDAILDFVVCEHLFQNRPQLAEGALTEIKSAAVSRRALGKVAKRLGLRPHLILGRGIGGHRNLPESVYANVFEALIAAVYLDGGLDAAREFILRHLAEVLRLAEGCSARHNYKSRLQEAAQGRGQGNPEYLVLSEAGPDHAKRFEVAVRLDGEEIGRGVGANKKQAQQLAARAGLRMLMGREPEE